MGQCRSPGRIIASNFELQRQLRCMCREKPVIAKALCLLDGPVFRAFAAQRGTWELQDCYRSPGPIQACGAPLSRSSVPAPPPLRCRCILPSLAPCSQQQEVRVTLGPQEMPGQGPRCGYEGSPPVLSPTRLSASPLQFNAAGANAASITLSLEINNGQLISVV